MAFGRSNNKYSDRQLNKTGNWFDNFFSSEARTNEEKMEGKDLSSIANAIAEQVGRPIKHKMEELRDRVGLDSLNLNFKKEAHDSVHSLKNESLQRYIDKFIEIRGGFCDTPAVISKLKDEGFLHNDDGGAKEKELVTYIEYRKSEFPSETEDKTVCPESSPKLDEAGKDEFNWGESSTAKQ